MPESFFDIDEAAFLAQMGAEICTPEVLAWWRSEKARRDARTPEEVARDEKEAAEQAALQGRLDAESTEYQEARRRLFEPVRRLLVQLEPDAYWPRDGDPALGGAEYTLSPAQYEQVVAKVSALQAAIRPRIRRIERQWLLRVGASWAVGVLTAIAVVWTTPRFVPSVLTLGFGVMIGYFAAVGCRETMKAHQFGTRHPSDLVDPETGEHVFALDRTLGSIRSGLEKGAAAREARASRTKAP